MLPLRPALLHLLGQATRLRTAGAFALAARDPGATQEARLVGLMRKNADTEYGRRHGFSDITSPATYARRLPLMTPADLEPWVDRLMAGERKLLTAADPVYYVRTTGSTGNAKHVPITAAYKAEFQKTVHVALWHLYARFPAAFVGRALYFVGSRRVARAADGNDIGTMSGFNFTELPPVLRAIYAWPYELFEVGDLTTRSYLALWLACLGDISLIAGIFPAPMVYLLRELSARADELAHDFRTGTLSPSLGLTAEQRAFFARFADKPRPELADRLTRAARAPEHETARIAWPRLRLAYCWTTSTAGLYVPELSRRLGEGVAVRDAIYSACEGWCSIPMGEEEPGGALAVTSHYFEFIPESDFDAGLRETRTAAELEDGRRYYIVLSTGAGLYRYLLGDIVEVCGFHHATPRIRFVRKAGAASNLVGEKLDESHVTRAVGGSLVQAGLEATWFTLAPELGGAEPGYALLVELAPASASADDAAIESLRSNVDRALGDASYDYGRLRAGGQLRPLVLHRLPAGSYQRVRQSKVKDGSAEAQLKTAHLVSDANGLPPELRPAR
ncbi:MAG TPA: GH3 auxin-responsive promoter family protein [Kofleriaceae bacterium]|nr:GH3 auxin-responsive promoter family protein [Kofleriaceae bacterium]